MGRCSAQGGYAGIIESFWRAKGPASMTRGSPLGVKSGPDGLVRARPVWPDQRTSIDRLEWSASCHSATSRFAYDMSAHLAAADIEQRVC